MPPTARPAALIAGLPVVVASLCLITAAGPPNVTAPDSDEIRNLLTTTPKAMDVTITQPFVCQIHSKQRVERCALNGGYIEKISVKEGQAVKRGEVMFEIRPVLYSAKAGAAPLADKEAVSESQLQLSQARRDRAEAKTAMVKAELGFTKNQDKFPQPCVNMTVEGQFNNQTGNIAFRADFPNPDGVLRHGQTGRILIHRTLEDALVIPQRATFERLDKQFVWVVGPNDVAHQALITVDDELEDIFVIGSGLEVTDKIVFEGVREVQEGGKVEYDFRKPEDVLNNQKFHAE